MESMIRRRGLNWHMPSIQPENMLGTVATLWSKQTQALASRAFEREMKDWWKDEGKQERMRVYEKQRETQWTERQTKTPSHYFILEKGVILFRFVCICVPVLVCGLTRMGKIPLISILFLNPCEDVCRCQMSDKLKEKLTSKVNHY